MENEQLLFILIILQYPWHKLCFYGWVYHLYVILYVPMLVYLKIINGNLIN
jgi:hypothetical protein